jgi:hypothetical protein
MEETYMKNKNYSKLMAAIPMAAVLIMPITAMADDTSWAVNQTDVGTGTTRSTTVTYSQASTFTVTIPKSISLGTNKTATYNIKVTGDISSDQQVNVAPQDDKADKDGVNFKMSDTATTADKKDDVWVTVIQSIKAWSSSEISEAGETGVTKTGTIDGSDVLTSGSWSGNLTFNISLTSVSS